MSRFNNVFHHCDCKHARGARFNHILLKQKFENQIACNRFYLIKCLETIYFYSFIFSHNVLIESDFGGLISCYTSKVSYVLCYSESGR